MHHNTKKSNSDHVFASHHMTQYITWSIMKLIMVTLKKKKKTFT